MLFVALGCLAVLVILFLLFQNTGQSERERDDQEFREFEKELHRRHFEQANRRRNR